MTEFDAAPNFTFNAVAAVPRKGVGNVKPMGVVITTPSVHAHSVLAPSKIENVQPDAAITVI